MTAPLSDGAREGFAPPPGSRLLRANGATETWHLPGDPPEIVKRLDPEKAAGDPLGFQRFRREQHLLSLLRHPALPVATGGGTDWFSLEFLPEDLPMRIAAGLYRSAAPIRALLSRLCDLLAYIHARGVSHHDIKPAHILFREQQPVLIDFGVASLLRNDPMGWSEISGTPAWMAPEQQAGRPCGPAADIWSLCAVGLWLLGAERPESNRSGDWPTAGWQEAVRQQAEKENGDAISVALDLARMFVTILQSGPEQRPTGAALARILSVS